MGSPSIELVNADFENIPEEQRRSYSLHKEILWESNNASEAELTAKEIEYIRMYRANDPVIGYNRWPKLRPDTSTPSETNVPGTT